MTQLAIHPLSSLFPALAGAEFAALVDDIRANGLRQSIVLYQGQILDGGNRYRACAEAGVEPRYVEYDGADPVSYVLSANLHRRHMTPGQQAAIVAAAQDWSLAHEGKGGDRRSTATLQLVRAKDRAAQSGASLRTQHMADKVAQLDPELAKKVAHGEVSLPKAVKQVEKKKSKPATPVSADTEAPESDAADLGIDPVEELQRVMVELDEAHALIKAAEANDATAEVLKWRRAYDHAMREQSAAMERAREATNREAWTMRQLRRCGKAVGEDDPTHIAAVVEAFVRNNSKAKAQA